MNAPEEASKSRRFFSDLIAKRLPHVKSIPGFPRMPLGLRGNLGWMRGPVKSAFGRVDGGNGRASRPRVMRGVTRIGSRQTDPTATSGGPFVKATEIDAGRGAADAERRH